MKHDLHPVSTAEPSSPEPSPEQAWVTPRLTFVEPKLTKHGDVKKVTGAFFGAFSPGAED